MSLNITFDGQPYIVPETGEVGWGGNTTSYLVAIAAGCLQKTGGNFVLSAETDFGASFGLKSLYYKSRSTNIATAGILRLNNNSDSINWRNAANSADLPLSVNASDQLIYNANRVLTGTGPADYVSSLTGTANQIIASGATGAVTLSLPQSIATSSALQFGTLGLGAAVVSSSILSLTSTALGFLPPRMTTTQRDAIGSPVAGLMIYNTVTNLYNIYNGTSWVALAMSGGGTVNAGVQNQLGYYAANGNIISGLTLITGSRALESDANGLPVASSVTSTELSYVSGVTSAIQTQIDSKAPLASPTFTGQVILPNGSAALPGAAFAGDSGSGMSWDGGGSTSLQFSHLGSLRLAFDTTNGWVISNARGIENVLGTISAPSYSTVASPGSGWYITGSGTVWNYGVNATKVLELSSVGMGLQDGSASQPIVYFLSDINTGVTRLGADTLGLITGAATRLSISNSLITSNTNLSLNSNKVTNLAAATANGDAVRFEQLGYFQAVQGTTDTQTVTTSTSFVSSSLSASITPSSTAHRVKVTINCYCEATAGGTDFLTVQRGATDLGNTDGLARIAGNSAEERSWMVSFSYIDSPSTVSATTYTLRGKTDGVNTLRFGGVSSSLDAVIILEEII